MRYIFHVELIYFLLPKQLLTWRHNNEDQPLKIIPVFSPRFVAYIYGQNTFYINALNCMWPQLMMAAHKRWSYPRIVRFNGKRIELFSFWKVKEKIKELTPHREKVFYR